MRPSRTVAGAALAVLALSVLPRLAGSREPDRDRPIAAVAFGQVDLAPARDRQADRDPGLDATGRSAGALRPGTALSESWGGPRVLGTPAEPGIAAAQPSWAWKPPTSVIEGEASFYDNGTTAMRLPRGTVVVICGAGGCIQRTINDYGPSAKGGRVIDLYRPDFFAICGCPSWSGTTQVTIRIY